MRTRKQAIASARVVPGRPKSGVESVDEAAQRREVARLRLWLITRSKIQRRDAIDRGMQVGTRGACASREVLRALVRCARETCARKLRTETRIAALHRIDATRAAAPGELQREARRTRGKQYSECDGELGRTRALHAEPLEQCIR